MVMLSIGYLRAARHCIVVESERLQNEQTAFSEFATTVHQMSIIPPQRNPSAPFKSRVATSENQLRTIRNCYRENIMTVPHYEEDYDETLKENMRVEFNNEIATAVVDGTQCTPQLQRLLVVQARRSAQQRANLLEKIQDERESLQNAYRHLQEADATRNDEIPLYQQPFAELVAYDQQLRTSVEDCEQLLMKRQQELHRSTQNSFGNHKQFCHYLYKGREFTFPVLNTTLYKIQSLRNRRQGVVYLILRYD